MRRVQTALLLLCVGAVMTACGHSVATPPRFVLPGTPEGRMCLHECQEARDYCQESCRLEQRQCTTHMQDQAIKDYDAYAQEQFLSRGPMDLRPSDFERPEKCLPTACLDACESPYETCFKRCGGKIVPTQSCQFLCF